MGDMDRIRWQCRRGLLEMDLILQRFLAEDFDSLTPEELNLFKELLGEVDTVLLAWVMRQEEAPKRYEALIRRLQRQ
jgi:succinate dehydrogenase flavin-adding protein (antitoxin of CptAB toxin-antitoxin module)